MVEDHCLSSKYQGQLPAFTYHHTRLLVEVSYSKNRRCNFSETFFSFILVWFQILYLIKKTYGNIHSWNFRSFSNNLKSFLLNIFHHYVFRSFASTRRNRVSEQCFNSYKHETFHFVPQNTPKCFVWKFSLSLDIFKNNF